MHIYGLDLTDTLAVRTFNEPRRLVLVRKKWATLPVADEQFIFPPTILPFTTINANRFMECF